ncbi:Ubiquitin-like modifier HUB1-like protein [Elsinoe fawcettii]|nr:Ubiquitin-like modifier HUB1-like protein [Elsinoe fawcettii]
MARSRSRSPDRPKRSKGGFKWKDKASKDTSEAPSKSTYRERSPKYDSRDRERSPKHDRERRRSRSRERRRHSDRDQLYREDRYQDRDSVKRTTRKEDEADTTAAPKTDTPPTAAPPPTTSVVDKSSIAAKFGAKALSRKPTPLSKDSNSNGGPPTAPQDPSLSAPAIAKPKYKVPSSSEPMIIVHVNDRLGTKAAIPCLASDPVKAFKAMVAARIGRQPHEIMLKRQGERPFKDQLTLEDYGVSNGVQLDLELDTGD